MKTTKNKQNTKENTTGASEYGPNNELCPLSCLGALTHGVSSFANNAADAIEHTISSNATVALISAKQTA